MAFFRSLALVALLLSAWCLASGDGFVNASARLSDDGKACVITSPPATTDPVLGSLVAEKQGWSTLTIESSSTLPSPREVRRLAGCLEGFLTSELIYNSYLNLFINWGYLPRGATGGTAVMPQKLVDFLAANLAFTRTVAVADEVVAQFDGLVEGYAMAVAHRPDRAISELLLWVMNSAGDMEELVGEVQEDPLVRARFRKISRDVDPSLGEVVIPEALLMQDCSALVVFNKTAKNLIMGHTTWRSYTQMDRIYKIYDLKGSPAVSFSSTPSFLSSKDDFYVTNAGLLISETTNNVWNQTLFQLYLTPKSLFTWVRTIIANTKNSCPEWMEAFGGKFNSGTYNNQWICGSVDEASGAPSLWIGEQIPGTFTVENVTGVLMDQGYFASYNIPRDKTIYEVSGYTEMYQKYGDAFSYEHNPRANIFRRDWNQAGTVVGMMKVMQSCGWPEDPLTLGSPGNCISSRYDLLPSGTPAAFGGIDSKVGSTQTGLSAYVISGPTHQNQSVFTWKSKWQDLPHFGQPESFDFNPITAN
jgi:hypothetical protein